MNLGLLPYSYVKFRGKYLHLPLQLLCFVVMSVSLLIVHNKKEKKNNEIVIGRHVIFKFEFFYKEI